MTVDEFNDKYDEWLEAGHYGLSINNEHIIKFLDNIFQDLTKIEGFSYSQIKLKYGMVRFYAEGISFTLSGMIENRLTKILEDK